MILLRGGIGGGGRMEFGGTHSLDHRISTLNTLLRFLSDLPSGRPLIDRLTSALLFIEASPYFNFNKAPILLIRSMDLTCVPWLHPNIPLELPL